MEGNSNPNNNQPVPSPEELIADSFNTKVAEWRFYSLISVFFWLACILFVQMLLVAKLLSGGIQLLTVLGYVLIQLLICIPYNQICSVYRQVPATIKEIFTKIVSFSHYTYIGSLIVSNYLLLLMLFNISRNTFSLSFYEEICTENKIGLILCTTYFNPFSLLLFTSSLLISSIIIYRTYIYQELVYSFPKVEVSIALSMKNIFYNSFWTSFYVSLHYVFISTFIGSFVVFILFKRLSFIFFLFQVIGFSFKIWFFALLLIFQHLLRVRLIELVYTRTFSFAHDRFRINQQITNPNVFLTLGIDSINPIIQHHAWNDFLYLSKFSKTRRNYLYHDTSDNSSLLKILASFDHLIFILIMKLNNPVSEEELNNIKNNSSKHQQKRFDKKQQQQKQEATPNIFEGLKNRIKKIISDKLDFNVLECELRQALSNTQSILWAIQGISALILNAYEKDKSIQALHQYQFIQRYMTTVVQLILKIEQVEYELRQTMGPQLVDKSTVNRSYHLFNDPSQELANSMQGVLNIAKPQILNIKYTCKNVICQLLSVLEREISLESFDHHTKAFLKQYKSGNVHIYG
ncbi:hypothetical protein DLAC_07630 [Tieghemostelium lacteum]|uniref:Uncharacterized protein n=1 Tax=Tieghemostelium lacteum TaxID=361077 RepID=A0A151ZD24_TIELA|nr:hypothetical protein DLAC_07630 [Tieghemostelium lacteum]|eukprot:KYQ91829.1 hypothetical protein DLAC_07630 [Tieghemostelium lacteum]